MANTHELNAGDIISLYGATFLLTVRHEYPEREIDAPGNVGVVFETECLHLEEGAAMPRHWVEREGGYRIQGNKLAHWHRIREA
ncbi:hypothetical protein [uncultured Sphingomonas sp.]|uniref:hypothetical protein n=1 Tax=uncultured Sphingomonas sp. TaxID=158754 RepID=UPI002593E328|nr:hypothetical protein [uncultured Sphingomonas sp.]